MKLQYVKNIYWYDGPILDLYINENNVLYLSTPFKEKKITSENPNGVSIDIVREYVKNICTVDDPFPPEEFWDYKTNLNVDYYLINNNDLVAKKDYRTVEFLEVDAKKMTDEDRKLEYDFD